MKRSNAMKGICPACEKETELTYISRVENIPVRGENIPVHVEYLKCAECESEFNDPNSTYDALDVAYREYRSRNSMVQPEAIKQFRERFGLTQIELANLLGLGGATLSRYENGALQDESHDTLISLAMQPENLLEMIEEKPNILSATKREKILTLLHKMTDEHERSFVSIYESRFGYYAQNIYSGYQSLNVSKLLSAMIFFCKDTEIPKTKLNKLLFYADFKHYKEYAISITGAQYAHLPYGPVPDNYEYYLATLLHEEKAIIKTERQINDYVGEYLSASKAPDLNLFSTTELKILASVKDFFNEFTAKKISTFSHEERGYQLTHDGELISFENAQFLRI
jgi:putative zinc finger/helix-turn-helix YgiT family protein